MKVTVQVAQVSDIIDIASRFVARNATLPILQNVYLKASIDTLTIRATDMEKYIEVEIPCQVHSEWAVTVNGKTLSDIIKTVEDQQCDIAVDQNTQILTIKTAKDTFDINGIAASEYVALPEIPNENKVSLDIVAFAKGVERVEFAVTEKNFSPVLTGVLLKAKKWDDKLIFVGTDSFRLAEYKAVSSVNENDLTLIIPKLTIVDMQKIAQYAMSKNTEQLQVQYSDNLVSFACTVDNMKLVATSLLIQGNFPDYERPEIMPTEFNSTILLDKNDCEKAIKKIGILTRDINNFIQIETNKDSINITSGKTDKGNANTSTSAIITGNDVQFGINGKYITDFTRIMAGTELIFNIVDNHKPLIIIDKNDTAYRYVVRPLINN